MAGESAISTVGIGLGLNYRGYNIVDLAKNCIFEEVLHLLLWNKLPNHKELADLRTRLSKLRKIPPVLKTILEALPKHSNSMDVMRTISSVLGILEPESTPVPTQASRTTSSTSRCDSSASSAPPSSTGTTSRTAGSGSRRRLRPRTPSPSTS